MESVSLELVNNGKEPSFYLFKHKDINGLQLPLKGSSRVKYISFNVSINYIALGTNAGGIHIFRKSSLRHYRFLNAKVFPQPDSSRIVDVGVTNVLFSSQEKYLAAALSSGHVAIWELNFDKREASQLVKKTDEHKGSTVTSICWNSSSTKLFIGDSKGCISALEVSTGKIRRVHTIIKEGPAIVQLDFADEILLISNTKRCVYYDQSKDYLVQIGTKGRDGQYGACFLRRTNDQTVIYCARPGARLWEVDSSGQVLSTQQYKKLLATTSSPIVGHVSGNEKDLVANCDTYNFPKLLVLRDQYLMTWTRESIIVIDPILGNIVLWNNQLENIEDVCCNRQDMFVFQTGGCLTRYSLIPPKQCAAKLFVMGDWLQCSKVLISCKTQIIPVAARDHVPEYVVRRVKEMLNDNLQHEVCIAV
ncbi:Hermansky-Pudlak syndrome 5 [Paramuricea clavata]|uniref:Hermansky-Pudlak syndrome 5 n=1 Tax=Paramuricea clavata TaxID=317549 RepID=A0A6S7HN53_PARCT|nr:Hermansky-Pudlak syndrome 5 [Paramuricea clavata]